MNNSNKNNKSIIGSPYTLPILLRMYRGFRPSQIAKSLNISEQHIHYYTNHLIAAKLI